MVGRAPELKPSNLRGFHYDQELLEHFSSGHARPRTKRREKGSPNVSFSETDAGKITAPHKHDALIFPIKGRKEEQKRGRKGGEE